LSSLLYFLIGPFYLSSFNGIRQSLAIAIFAVSLKYIKTKELNKFLILIFLGTTIHQSIIFLIPMYFIFDKKLNLFIVLILFLTSIVVSSTGLINTVINLTSYSRYLTNDFSTFETSGYIYLAIAIITTIFGLNFKNTNNNLLFNMVLFSSIFMTIAIIDVELPYNILLRVNNYLFIATMILIPNIIGYFKENKTIGLVLIILSLILFVNTLSSDQSLIPYDFNFDLFY
jgi:hypothetical protein